MGHEILEGSIIKLAPGKSLLCLNNGSLQLDLSSLGELGILIKQFNGTKEPLDLPSWPQGGGYIYVQRDSISSQNQDGVYDGNLYIKFDEDITDILAQNQRLGFIITIKDCNCNWRVQVEGDELQASWASRKAQEKAFITNETPEEIKTEANFDEPNIEAKNTKDNSKLKLILMLIGGALLLALIFLIIYFLFFKHDSVPTSVNQAQQEQSSPVSTTESFEDKNQNQVGEDLNSNLNQTGNNLGENAQVNNSVNPIPQSNPCSLSEGNDSILLKNCFNSTPSSETLENLAYEALDVQRCDLAKRLMSNLARNGNTKLALALAKYADPNVQESNSCIKKDAKSAAYWYQKVLEQSDNKEALAAMEKLK